MNTNYRMASYIHFYKYKYIYSFLYCGIFVFLLLQVNILDRFLLL